MCEPRVQPPFSPNLCSQVIQSLCEKLPCSMRNYLKPFFSLLGVLAATYALALCSREFGYFFVKLRLVLLIIASRDKNFKSAKEEHHADHRAE